MPQPSCDSIRQAITARPRLLTVASVAMSPRRPYAYPAAATGAMLHSCLYFSNNRLAIPTYAMDKNMQETLIPKLQPTKWLAQRLNLSLTTIERLRTQSPQSLPPHVAIGKSIRYDERAVENWLQAQLKISASS
jgi:predicted DNA-binding transcriptional regulator AlpA